MKVMITAIHPNDAFADEADELVCHTGTFEVHGETEPGYFSGRFGFDELDRHPLSFYAIQVAESTRHTYRIIMIFEDVIHGDNPVEALNRFMDWHFDDADVQPTHMSITPEDTKCVISN